MIYDESKQEAFRLHIEEYYGGDLSPFVQHIDSIVFMLLFLDPEQFTRKDIQQAGYFLKNLKDTLSDK